MSRWFEIMSLWILKKTARSAYVTLMDCFLLDSQDFKAGEKPGESIVPVSRAVDMAMADMPIR